MSSRGIKAFHFVSHNSKMKKGGLIFTFDEKIYKIEDDQLKFLASEAFKDLDYEKRPIASKLIGGFKSNS